MKDHLLQLVAGVEVAARRNLAREYLQVYLLRLLHEANAARYLAFVGGTALRLLYQVPRFSEDLDFSGDAIGDPMTADMAADLFTQLKVELARSGYEANAKLRTARNVASALFRFEHLPHALGLTLDPRLALSVKVDIDLRPPPGAQVETTLIQRFFPIALRHYDLASLFGGKLHAVLTRSYTKGRDWYDLVWYLTRQPRVAPNLTLLANALKQTGHPELDAKKWQQAAQHRLKELDWEKVLADLRPFVERQSDLDQLSKQLVQKAIGDQSAP